MITYAGNFPPGTLVTVASEDWTDSGALLINEAGNVTGTMHLPVGETLMVLDARAIPRPAHNSYLSKVIFNNRVVYVDIQRLRRPR